MEEGGRRYIYCSQVYVESEAMMFIQQVAILKIWYWI